ncbi:hypothetical protein Tco_0678689 [Tanacetum coccineum]|uniref:Uncharacterized protein n=1 Tax=Tanacetum coccineum TaxID=301880 RepID=A0ABQ4XFS3_9ASTR
MSIRVHKFFCLHSSDTLFDPKISFFMEEIFYHLRNEPVSCHSPLLISLPPPQYEIPMSAIEHMEDLDKGLGNDRKRANKAMTDEFVLAHVRTFLNLEILIEDIKVRKRSRYENLSDIDSIGSRTTREEPPDY